MGVVKKDDYLILLYKRNMKITLKNLTIILRHQIGFIPARFSTYVCSATASHRHV